MRPFRLLLLPLVALGCGDSGTTSSPPADVAADVASSTDAATEDAASFETASTDTTPLPDISEGPDVAPPDPKEWYTFEAGPFTVPAGSERFFCFTKAIDEAVTTNELVLDSRPVVHHVLFSQNRTPDPEGFRECSVLFQNNWSPIFVSGTGDATLVTPEGSGYVLPNGTQLTMQLHLVNPTGKDVTETVPMRMRRVTAVVEPVNVVVFGNLNVALPPEKASQVIAACHNDEDMKLFAAFPHMHLHGTAMRFATGPDEAHLTEVFKRDPYDFDAQYMDPLDLTIKAGDAIRVTCDYFNTSKEIVTFGESTTNEMCFFIGFATGPKNTLAGCIGGPGASGFMPAACGSDPPNDKGLGKKCTKGGGECASGQLCTEDYEQISGPATCIGIGCASSSECGDGGAVCCSPKIAGFDIQLCVPPSCEFSGCNPLD